MRKGLIIVLFVTGMLLASWPRVQSYIGDRETYELLEAWNKMSLEENLDGAALDDYNILIERTMEELFEIVDEHAEATEIFILPGEQDSQNESIPPVKKVNGEVKKSVVAMLEIDKISLKLPVLEGATQENMKNALATIKKNQTPGVGNYSIAGHRNSAFGKNFNRLMELDVDDEIVLGDGKKTFIYRVTEKFLVEPTEVEVIRNQPEISEITLVTCHPVKNPTHRLIVKGILEAVDYAEEVN